MLKLMQYNFYLLAYCSIFFGQIADCVTTLRFLKYGVELNPVINLVISYSPAAFAILKILAAAILVLMISRIRIRSEVWGRRTAKAVVYLSVFPPFFNVIANGGV